MLRLTLLLCIGMYAALMIAGEDRGQMRPGLATAALNKGESSAISGAELQQVATAEPERVVEPASVEAAATAATAIPLAETATAAPEPAPYVEPERTVVTAVEEPVFSLAALGNEAVPEGAVQDTSASPEVSAGGEGTIWYVTASSVNVRAEPSTEAEIVGKLGEGEATLVVQSVDGDWARIVIQGDGVEGFVAMRYLSAEAP
ncbi:MAG TPA: SH3 domain-containing protein [Tabrizicola sp.]|nr:SH3 domain-containing protein [Tabrizicola sp.]